MNPLILCAIIGIATAAPLSSETTPLLPQTRVTYGASEHENVNTIENTEPQDTHWLLERICRMPQEIAERVQESVFTTSKQLQEEARFVHLYSQIYWKRWQASKKLDQIEAEFYRRLEVLYTIRPCVSWSVLKKD